ncbi:hypothetical protein [Aquitalea magnusonii]|uniref:hypothetical protein n=1 Tax=Aquitalea magnusonii TaxID=332411 RepID=UPI001EFAC422|nr:hypothetical protein [Aquitalea magnusonii]
MCESACPVGINTARSPVSYASRISAIPAGRWPIPWPATTIRRQPVPGSACVRCKPCKAWPAMPPPAC